MLCCDAGRKIIAEDIVEGLNRLYGKLLPNRTALQLQNLPQLPPDPAAEAAVAQRRERSEKLRNLLEEVAAAREKAAAAAAGAEPGSAVAAASGPLTQRVAAPAVVNEYWNKNKAFVWGAVGALRWVAGGRRGKQGACVASGSRTVALAVRPAGWMFPRITNPLISFPMYTHVGQGYQVWECRQEAGVPPLSVRHAGCAEHEASGLTGMLADTERGEEPSHTTARSVARFHRPGCWAFWHTMTATGGIPPVTVRFLPCPPLEQPVHVCVGRLAGRRVGPGNAGGPPAQAGTWHAVRQDNRHGGLVHPGVRAAAGGDAGCAEGRLGRRSTGGKRGRGSGARAGAWRELRRRAWAGD